MLRDKIIDLNNNFHDIAEIGELLENRVELFNESEEEKKEFIEIANEELIDNLNETLIELKDNIVILNGDIVKTIEDSLNEIQDILHSNREFKIVIRENNNVRNIWDENSGVSEYNDMEKILEEVVRIINSMVNIRWKI